MYVNIIYFMSNIWKYEFLFYSVQIEQNPSVQVPAEWHFLATSHGKGACDGVGGTVKHLAALANLQRPYNEQIITPWYLCEWAQNDIPAVRFHYCTQEEYVLLKCHLEDRFAHCRPIVGTQSSLSHLNVKNTTALSMSKEQILVLKDDICFDGITGFDTCRYDSQ